MTPYILSLAAASLAAALVELLAPKGEGGRLAAGIRMVAGLFLLVALLSPLRAGLELLVGLSDGTVDLPVGVPSVEAEDYESTLQASILSLGEAELTAWVGETLRTAFGVSPEEAEVIPVWAESEALPPPLAEVYILLSGTAALEDPHPIEAYFADALGCSCRVSVTLS